MNHLKKIIVFASICSVIFTGGIGKLMASPALSLYKLKPGDVNGDDIVSINDALLAAKYTADENPSPFYPQAADVDHNGVININDALLLARYSAYSITQFPYNGAFPRIDETTNWIIGEQHFDNILKAVHIHNLDKRIVNEGNVYENRRCFRSIEIAGVIIDGWEYHFDNSIYQQMSQTAELITIDGLYRLSGITDSVALKFEFYNDGKFRILCSLHSDQSLEAAVPVKIDYDFNTGSNNSFEFVWNKKSTFSGNMTSKDPPDRIPSLHYNLPSGWYVDYWSAVENEVKVSFPKLSTVSNEKSNENTALFRVKDLSVPGREFGAVFWAANAEYDLIFKQRNEAAEINPQAVESNKIQSCIVPDGENAYYPKYVTNGTDQMAYVIVKGVKNGQSDCGIYGKLFQRSGGRRLHVKVHTFPDLKLYNDSKPYWFNPDLTISVEGNQTRTFRKALAELVGDPKLLSISVIQETAYPPSYTYPLSSDDRFNYSPHELLYHNRDMSNTARENTDEMTVDVYIVNYSQGDKAMMFDWSNGGDNQIEREGAIAYWGDFLKAAGDTARVSIPDWHAKAISEALLHEIGHTLGFDHDYNDSIRTIMSKDFFNPANQSLKFLDQQKTWFLTSPDSWVKPGRYSVNFGGAFY